MATPTTHPAYPAPYALVPTDTPFDEIAAYTSLYVRRVDGTVFAPVIVVDVEGAVIDTLEVELPVSVREAPQGGLFVAPAAVRKAVGPCHPRATIDLPGTFGGSRYVARYTF